MFPYFVVLTIIMLLVYANKSENKYIKLKDISIFFSMVILIAFAGLRNVSVGTDTGNYVGMFTNFQFENKSIFEIETTLERGYLILQKIALAISTDYWSLLTLIAAVCVFCNFYIIKKLSQNIRLSIFIYISLAVYVVFFNAARQGLAISISAISILYIVRKDFLRFIICIVIASFFHRTVLIMLPFYFILRIPFTYKKALLFFVIGFAAFYSFSKVITVFDSTVEERYAVYEDRGATGGELLALFFIVLAAFLMRLRNKITLPNLKLYDVYLNLCLFTAIIYIVVIFTGSDVNFIRITNYFAIGFVLIWPIVFKDVKLFRQSHIKSLFVVVHLLFYAIYLSKMSNLTPYLLNLNLL
jgi:transmembrane protein EpsG